MLVVWAEGGQVYRRVAGSGAAQPLPVPESASDVQIALTDWADRYARAVATNDEKALRDIGREMFAWLNSGEALRDWLAGGERPMEIRTDPSTRDALADALLAAPWELLGDENGFFADETRLFSVARRCAAASGDNGSPDLNGDLAMLFMAAAPEGQSDLDYEAEEAAILEATELETRPERLAHVDVEETAALPQLAERVRLDGPFEALHLSCHGEIVTDDDGRPRPSLLLETAEGRGHLVDADRLVTDLGPDLPPLVFVSACRTAARGEGRSGEIRTRDGFRRDMGLGGEGASDDAAPHESLAVPFVRELAEHTANVLGWDGYVADHDASWFAQVLYGELARGATVPVAAAKARRELRRRRDPQNNRGLHWHLARVYLGPNGGGALCDPQGPKRPAPAEPEQAFLDDNKTVPVAGRREFVGRRRDLQTALRAYAEGHAGVLLHGMGNLGKSSLAARLAARMSHLQPVVVVGRCNQARLMTALESAVRAATDAATDLDRATRIEDEFAKLTDRLDRNQTDLETVLRQLLRRTFAETPILLILDDLEQGLEQPSRDKARIEPLPDERPVLQAVLTAFREGAGRSRLLLTSRFDFAVPEATGNDATADLRRIHLAPMPERERLKQWRAARRGRSDADPDTGLVQRALAAGAGNPGLQADLTRPLLNGEPETAERAIAAIEAFHERGERPPADADAGDFFRRMAFDEYLSALTGAERDALRAATLFDEGVPIPRPAMAAAVDAIGVAEPEAALDRLLALGLLDDMGAPGAGRGTEPTPAVAADPLARPLVEPLSEDETATLAAAVLKPLAQAWRDSDGRFPLDARAGAATRLALAAEPTDCAVLDSAATAALFLMARGSQDFQTAVAFARLTFDVLQQHEYEPNPNLLGEAIESAGLIGDNAFQDRLLEHAQMRDDLNTLRRAQFLGHRGDRLLKMGQIDAAKDVYEAQALPLFQQIGHQHQIAVAKTQIAEILIRKNELNAARRMLENEALPVFEDLDEPYSYDVAKSKLATVMKHQKYFDDALAMHMERLNTAEGCSDLNRVANVRFSCAETRIARRDHERGDLQTIHDELAEAFQINQRLGRPDWIGAAGFRLGQVLAMGGHPETSQAVLETAAQAYDKLEWTDLAQQCRDLIAQIEEMKANAGSGSA